MLEQREALNALVRLISEYPDQPCRIYRLWPWTFPRAVEEELPPELETRLILHIETLDLLKSCPTWSCPCLPLRPAMREFRRRWSHKWVQIGPPESPAYGDPMRAAAYSQCMTRTVWRVLGPAEFLRELGDTIEGYPEFPESLSYAYRPARRPLSMYLCQHEIRGD